MTAMIQTSADPVEDILKRGIKDRWYPVLPSSMLTIEKPVSRRILGYKIALWRDTEGNAHAVEDHCPHRGAPLSLGANLGDRLQCPYHGVEVDCTGKVRKVPGSPGCKLDGSRPTRMFHVREVADVIFLYNATDPHLEEPPELILPEQITSPEFSSFLCYCEWKSDYRMVIDNVADPMHGAFLHKMSHSMSEGETEAKFVTTDTEHGFIFEKEGQRGVNFDWSEFADTNLFWQRLEIPYPKTGGPGGNFHIIGMYVPINDRLCAVFHWRCRPLTGWQKDTWRFLYKNRLEARHWHVLEQDRVALEGVLWKNRQI